MERPAKVAMRGRSDRPAGPLRSALSALVRAPAVLALIWPMALVVISYVAWQQYGRYRVAAKFQSLDRASLDVTPPPPHVRSDVVANVYADTGLEKISVLDPDAAAKIATAFALHPWVDQVSGVRKMPGGGVKVYIDYRHVAAMVRVFKPNSGRQAFFFPVDREGRLLPTEDFSSVQTGDYVHIDMPGAYSTAAVGARFGDVRVEAAAALAGLIANDFRAMRIEAIEAAVAAGPDGRPIPGIGADSTGDRLPQLMLRMTDGRRLHWGSPPGREVRGEADASAKLQYLQQAGIEAVDDLRWAGAQSRFR